MSDRPRKITSNSRKIEETDVYLTKFIHIVRIYSSLVRHPFIWKPRNFANLLKFLEVINPNTRNIKLKYLSFVCWAVAAAAAATGSINCAYSTRDLWTLVLALLLLLLAVAISWSSSWSSACSASQCKAKNLWNTKNKIIFCFLFPQNQNNFLVRSIDHASFENHLPLAVITITDWSATQSHIKNWIIYVNWVLYWRSVCPRGSV